MKIDQVQVQLVTGGNVLGEYYESDVLDHSCNCFVEVPDSSASSFAVVIRDDTTLAVDWFDLRAQVTVAIDGIEQLRTRNCVLLRDNSEYVLSGNCSRTLPSFPFTFAKEEMLKNDGQSMGQVEVTYTRYHKTSKEATASKQRRAERPAMAEAGLNFADSTSAETSLASHRFTFFYAPKTTSLTRSTEKLASKEPETSADILNAVSEWNVYGRYHKL